MTRPIGLQPDDLAKVMATFGVAEAQVRRDHAISHILAALSRHRREDLIFFGGTALSRTYLLAGRSPPSGCVGVARRGSERDPEGLLRLGCICGWVLELGNLNPCFSTPGSPEAGALRQPRRPAQLVETKRGKARSGQLVDQPQGEVALLLSCRGELPLFGVKFPKEAVVGLDGRVEIGQRRCWDGQGTDVCEVDFLCSTGS